MHESAPSVRCCRFRTRLARGHSADAHDGDELALSAPLAPNINDKGCAFGGSLVSLMTLAGWGLIVLKLGALDRDCDVYVQDSSVRYLAPVWSDFIARARLAAPDQRPIGCAEAARAHPHAPLPESRGKPDQSRVRMLKALLRT